MSLFSKLTQGDPIEVVEMCRKFSEDPHPQKQNLSIGGFLNERGQTHLFDVVRKVEQDLLREPDFNHAYLPTLGFPETNRLAMEFLFGQDHEVLKQGRAFCLQSIGGTGPLRVGAEFLKVNLGMSSAFYSEPTWINHRDIFLKAGFGSVQSYPYWDNARQCQQTVKQVGK